MDMRKNFIIHTEPHLGITTKKQYDMIDKPGEFKIRIYGRRLGTTKDIIELWTAIERNYVSIMAYNKLITLFGDFQQGDRPDIVQALPSGARKIRVHDKKMLLDHFEKYSISDIVSPDDYPLITKINFNSPGWWEVIGQLNIFEQLREYLKERHLRKKEKEFTWDSERQISVAEFESKKLNNDLLKLDITQKMIEQLKEIGFSEVEIRHYVQKCYGNLYLLDRHIDVEIIVDIKIVDGEE